MRFFFILLSAAYIAGIFLWADSSVVSELSAFNPYSVLHIPLYGILTMLLFFSLSPLKLRKNVINGMIQKRKNPMNPLSPTNYFVVGVIEFCFFALTKQGADT